MVKPVGAPGAGHLFQGPDAPVWAHIGMAGSENTPLVTLNGGKSLTDNHPGLMLLEECRAWAEAITPGF